MNRISLIIKQRMFGIIFIVIAVIGGVVIFWYISNLKAKISEDADCKQVFITKTDIIQGEEITEELIESQKIPENIFTENFVTDKSEIMGKEVIEDISEGEIIIRDKIKGMEFNDGSDFSFSSYIPYDLRAVSVPVNFYGDGSFIRSGDRVDLISTYYEQESSVLCSDMVLSEKEIVFISSGRGEDYSGDEDSGGNLLIDSMFENSSVKSSYGSIQLILTFYLNTSEAEEVFLALEKGMLNLSLCPKRHLK